jgi:hypothetical protein
MYKKGVLLGNGMLLFPVFVISATPALRRYDRWSVALSCGTVDISVNNGLPTVSFLHK